MPRNEDSELEMVLGNRQLLTIFFLVIILLGVFFTLGYILGRNSAPMDAAARREAEQLAASQDLPSSGARTSRNTPVAETQTVAEAEDSDEYSRPSPVRTEPQTELEESGSVPAPVEMVPAATAGIDPEPGTYIQVLAVARPEAELLTQVLVKKGFHAFVAAGPNARLFRVLVGPTKDSTDTVKTKAELAEAGFTKAFVKRF
ncbi:MAG: SPOR domain-containing protein [Bryobacteraceae bacterium]